MAVAFAPVRFLRSLMTPSKPTSQPQPPTTPTSGSASSQVDEEVIEKSFFSDRPSQYMSGRKRKFELEFNLRQEVKRTKIDTTPTAKRKREDEFETPQKRNKTKDHSQTAPVPRSALKRRINQPKTPATAIKKTVTFDPNPLTSTKQIRPYVGRAGKYSGSIFADADPTTVSSPEEASPAALSSISDASTMSLSPTTKSNTDANTPSTRQPVFADPNDPYWTPLPHNPRPGEFCLPDDLSFYDVEDNESMIEGSITPKSTLGVGSNTPNAPETGRKGYNAVFPDSPETPRISHASLPSIASQSTPAVNSEYPTSPHFSHSTPAVGIILADSDGDAVNKARAAAEKYKPESVGKQASKLSQVTQARSRSSSPPSTTAGIPAFSIDPALVVSNKENVGSAQKIKNVASSSIANEYEQQYDDWAHNLEWPQRGEKIVEDEVFKSSMMDHILKEWTKEDDEQSETFWNREFDRVVEAGRRADREGKMLMFF